MKPLSLSPPMKVIVGCFAGLFLVHITTSAYLLINRYIANTTLEWSFATLIESTLPHAISYPLVLYTLTHIFPWVIPQHHRLRLFIILIFFVAGVELLSGLLLAIPTLTLMALGMKILSAIAFLGGLWIFSVLLIVFVFSPSHSESKYRV